MSVGYIMAQNRNQEANKAGSKAIKNNDLVVQNTQNAFKLVNFKFRVYCYLQYILKRSVAHFNLVSEKNPGFTTARLFSSTRTSPYVFD